jgi:rhamnose utilization protein RhaD (predicted bifunctional aldolase and dehydrogenase)
MEVSVITDDIFAQMVAEEVKNKLVPSRRQELLKEENWDRWRRALYALCENLNEQIADLEVDAKADAIRYKALGQDGVTLAKTAQRAYEQKLQKINRFKFHVESRLNQVESMIADGVAPEDEETVAKYRTAISKHKELLEEYDMESTSIDRALWGVLDGKWEFDSIDVSTL